MDIPVKQEEIELEDVIFQTEDETGNQTQDQTRDQPDNESENELSSRENALSDDNFVLVNGKSDSDIAIGNENDPFDVDNLENHETKNVEEKPKTITLYRCDTCGIGYSEKGKMKYHKGLDHTLQCYLCEQQCDSKKDFMRHFAKHPGFSKGGKPVNEESLVLIVKAPQKPCKCNLCDRGFSDEGSLTRHMKDAHQISSEQEKKIEKISKEKALARNFVNCAYCKVEMPKESMRSHLPKCDAKVRYTHLCTSK